MNVKKLFILLLIVCISSVVFSAEKKDLWEVWKKTNEYGKDKLDHSAWTYLLEKYVTTDPKGINVVAYANFNKNDKIILARYLDYLGKVPVSILNRNEQMAFWINLYNALTWDIVLKNYPTSSIRKINISPGTFTRGPWDKKVIIVSNQIISLNDIEHRILRPIWNDDRIHYALNCASVSCPNIAKEAYTSDNLERLLNEGRSSYINDNRGVTFKKNGDLVLSSIYKWYIEDFAYDDTELVAYLIKYSNSERAGLLSKWNAKENNIKYDYDWDLNE